MQTKSEILTPQTLDQEIATVVNAQIAKISDVIKAHGGEVKIVSASEELLVLKLEGHCASCALAPLTFGVALNKHIKEALPQLKEIKYTF